jgi:hypothetical protein
MRIRLQDEGPDRFKVILPEENKNFPVGLVWKDMFSKQAWKIKFYFPVRGYDRNLENKTYDDFMKAAREIANCYVRNNFLLSHDNEEEYGFVWPDATD